MGLLYNTGLSHSPPCQGEIIGKLKNIHDKSAAFTQGTF